MASVRPAAPSNTWSSTCRSQSAAIWQSVPIVSDLSTSLPRAHPRTFLSKLTLSEVSGSFGDLGTFIPLTVALARIDAISLPPALFFSGLSNYLAGVGEMRCAGGTSVRCLLSSSLQCLPLTVAVPPRITSPLTAPVTVSNASI